MYLHVSGNLDGKSLPTPCTIVLFHFKRTEFIAMRDKSYSSPLATQFYQLLNKWMAGE